MGQADISQTAALGSGQRAGVGGGPKLSRSTWLLSIYWAVSRFNGTALRPWALRGTIDREGPPFCPNRSSSAGPGSLGLCAAWWCPCPLPLPHTPGFEQAPGNARLRWEGLGGAGPAPHCPQSPEGSLQGVAITVRRQDTWPGLTFAPPQAGLQCPQPSGPFGPQPPQSLISRPSEQLVLPGKLPNESTMRDCGGGMTGKGPFSLR